MVNTFLILVVIPLVTIGAAFGQTSSRQGLVENIKNKAVVDGCGCYFRFRATPESADRYIFFSSIEDGTDAPWMNIAGRDVKLKVKERKGLFGKPEEKVGSVTRWIFTGQGITVNGTWIVTRVCDPNDENCESTQYDGSFVVRKGARSQVVKAVGSCGC